MGPQAAQTSPSAALWDGSRAVERRAAPKPPLINICTSIGTLLSAAAIGALADFSGGGVHGFAIAYLAVGALMLAMMFATLALRDDRGLPVAARAAQ